MRQYKIYLPKDMWGNLFRSLPLKKGEFIITDFPVGKRGTNESTESIVETALKKASKECKNKKFIPIIVFPLGSIYKYSSYTNNLNESFPKIKIIGPAFSSRDDIFLFLGKNKTKIKEKGKKVKIVKKGSDLTTTAIASIYRRDIIENKNDPLFNLKPKNGHNLTWDYSIEYVNDDCDEVFNSEDLFGCVAAGPELKTFWENHYWITAVNLNAWICNKYKSAYFTRATFVSLSDCFEDETTKQKIELFWKEFISASKRWFEKINLSQQRRVNGYYINNNLALPTQIPALIIKNDVDYVSSIAQNIIMMKKFQDDLYEIKDLSNYSKFKFNHIHVYNDKILWKIVIDNYREKIGDMFFTKIIVPTYEKNSSEKSNWQGLLRKEFENLIYEFINETEKDLNDATNLTVFLYEKWQIFVKKHGKELLKREKFNSNIKDILKSMEDVFYE